MKEKAVKITLNLTAKQYNFIEKNNIDPKMLLKKAIKNKKQKKLQEEYQLRSKKFNNEFKKIKSRVEGYIKERRINDSIWKIRYKHAKTLTRSHFISYG